MVHCDHAHTIMEIWRLNGVTILTFWGHVTSSATLPFDFLWVVYGDHVSILHRYGDMAFQMLDALMW